jgi:predicted  nucleic acid-binding Zn-ribbon protein
MTDDILREALQGMRQPQPGLVYIADVLAHVEPELERLRRLEMFGNEEHAKRLSEIEGLQDKVRHLNRRDEIHSAGLKLAHRRQAELKADRDRARDAAVALEQENARLTERIAAAVRRARTRDEDLLHMRDNSKNAQRTMSRGHAWEVAAYEVRTIADLLDGGETP